ncbi:tetratricopeptide repeat protein [uncultured Piscinibacter sp.]|uniref:tetratricopeptide repeat protein n=1 Tax=uncultured Piscinibacter sp. TaxID=1131835 RepID=UPI002629350E|nr:tetratricopeptide repeat protein [uncultured Piscinibacter sp.]
MLDITLTNFEHDVIDASMRQPVLLDIWAPWCGPCKSLGPVLEKLETAYAGRFVLAKLNSDEQPEIAGQLSQMFGVRSIPFCVMFKQGQPVDGFVGALPEGELRQFLDKHVPSEQEQAGREDVSEAHELLQSGRVDDAIERLKQAVALDPDNDAARAVYLRALLGAGRIAEAEAAMRPVAGRSTTLGEDLAACAMWLRACKAMRGESDKGPLSRIQANPRDLEARFQLAQWQFSRGRFTDALDQLLEILMRDKQWHEGLARTTYLAVLQLLRREEMQAASTAALPDATSTLVARASPPAQQSVADTYHRRLSMALF